jgi:predicted ATPase
MFHDRGQAVRADFAVDDDNRGLVTDICRRLDGLPLAVELAAARLRSLPLPQLIERLDDRFRLLTGGARTALPRQQTLRAVVDWSYDLLFDAERQVFMRLSVFTGGCSLEAAEQVCSDEVIAADEVCDLLLHLVDKSLVIADVGGADAARYTQLQTLWQYGRERLAESKDVATCRDRHARWFLDLATNARAGLRGRTGVAWRARIDADFDNLRAALDWFAANNDAAGALALVDGVAWCWFVRNDPMEATRWLDDALAVKGDFSTELRAMVVAWRVYFGAQVFGPATDRRHRMLPPSCAPWSLPGACTSAPRSTARPSTVTDSRPRSPNYGRASTAGASPIR